MRWYRQLRWKLFISHMVIIAVAVVVLLVSANILATTKLAAPLPLTLEASAAETVNLDDTPALSGSQLQRFQLVVAQSLLIAGFAALSAAVVVSLFISQRLVEPLLELSRVSRHMAQGYYHERTKIRSDDELAELSQSVNALAEALEQTERRRLHLLADVAHELRTPLATIEGYMEGLIDGVLPPTAPIYSLVLRESVRLQRLVEDLQLLSRAEAGQLSIQPQRVELRSLLEALLEQFRPQYQADQIELQLQIEPEIPPIWADPDRVNQMLINLLTNAYRYTPPGGRVLLQAQRDGDAARIAVIDSGIGIAAEHLPQIFERFYRVDKSRDRSSGGSGVGLTITRHLAYAQGGEIWAESDGPGRGARFHITLPFAAS